MALDYFVCGTGGGSGVSSLTIPITVDVPRTDPTLGASVVLIFYQTELSDGGATPLAVADDAPVDDAYSLCLFSDGLNKYNPSTEPIIGLLANPLVAGTNSITLTFGGTITCVQAVAVAVTGMGGSWPAKPFDFIDPTLAFIFGATAEAPYGAPTSTFGGVNWTDTGSGGAPAIHEPVAASTDRTWDWLSGELGFFFLQDNHSASDELGWTWADVAIADFHQWDVDPGTGFFMSAALGVQTPIVPGAQGPSVDGAWGNGGSKFQTSGNAIGFISGPGPTPCAPPPVVGIPGFNRVIPV